MRQPGTQVRIGAEGLHVVRPESIPTRHLWKAHRQVRVAITLFSALHLIGCAMSPVVVPARMYDMSSGKILNASFVWKGETTGPIQIANAEETCAGEYERSWVEPRPQASASRARDGVVYTARYIRPVRLTRHREANVRPGALDGHGICKDNSSLRQRPQC